MTPTGVDARLLVPAAAVWVVAAGARWLLLADPLLAGRAEVAGDVLVACVVVAPVLAVLAIVPRRVILVVATAAWAAVTATALSTVATGPDPVASWADDRATATVTAVVAGEPELHHGGASWSPPWLQVRLATSAMTARGQRVDVDLPLVVRLPATASSPPPGSTVTVTGRLEAAWPGSDAAVALSADRVVAVADPGPIDAVAQAMRAGLRSALAGRPEEPAALVAGLAIGDESAQPEDLADAMRESGLAHLTAVSGGNIAIVLGVVLAAAGLARASLRSRTVASLGAVAGFTVLVGPQPSVLRAVAMGVIATVGVLAGGRRAGPAVLAAGVIVLVLVAPWLATSWGFALSALATAGIVLLGPLVRSRLEAGSWTGRWPRSLQEAVALTVSAQVGTLPVLVAMGGAVGWVAVPANLLAAPFVPAVTVLGLAAALVSPVVPALATGLAYVATWPAAVIVRVAHLGAGLPLSGIPLPPGWAGVGVLGGLTAVGWLAFRAWRRLAERGCRLPPRWAVAVSAAAVVMLLVLAPPSRRGWPPPGWLLVMCDVGQGDALVLSAGEGSAVVVDTGPDPDLVDDCLDALGVVEVPSIVLTHFHADHVGGLAGVLRDRHAGEVLVTGVRDPADQADRVDDVLAEVGLVAREVRAGEEQTVGPVSWRAIWPARRIDAGSVPNNASIVLDVRTGGRRLLLTGDIETEAQQAIATDLGGGPFDVVKVPHHGSADVAADLTTWAPASLALISVGADNDYGHPAASTVAAWRAVGAQVVRTDESGDVAVVPVGPHGVGAVTRR